MSEESIFIVPEAMRALIWAEGDGPYPYVYNDKPKGHRCAWSVFWQTTQGIVIPDDWVFLQERATIPELYYELLDVRDRSSNRQVEAVELLRGGASAEAMPNKKDVIAFLADVREARSVYKEYKFQPKAQPGTGGIYRPGWEPWNIDPAVKKAAVLRDAGNACSSYFKSLLEGDEDWAEKCLEKLSNNPEFVKLAMEVV